MKSAYELAMERLNESAPQRALTDDQKAQIAELDSVFKAKIAGREVFLTGEIAKAEAGGDFASIDDLKKQLASERKALEGELEDKKEAVRNSGS